MLFLILIFTSIVFSGDPTSAPDDAFLFKEAKKTLAELTQYENKFKDYYKALEVYKFQRKIHGKAYNTFTFNEERKNAGLETIYELHSKYNRAQKHLEAIYSSFSKNIAKEVSKKIVSNRPRGLNELLEFYNKQLIQFDKELNNIPKDLEVDVENRTFKNKPFVFPQIEKDAMTFYNKENIEAKKEILTELINKIKSNTKLNRGEYSQLENFYVEKITNDVMMNRSFSSTLWGHVKNSAYMYGVIIVKEGVMCFFNNYFTLNKPELMTNEAQSEINKTPIETSIEEFLGLFTREAIPGHVGFLSFGFASDFANKRILSKIERAFINSKFANNYYVLKNTRVFIGKTFSRFWGMVIGMYVSHVVTVLGSNMLEFSNYEADLINSLNEKYGRDIQSNQSEINKSLWAIVLKQLIGKESFMSVGMGGLSFELAHYIIGSLQYSKYAAIIGKSCDFSFDYLRDRQISMAVPRSPWKKVLSFSASVGLFSLADIIQTHLLGGDGFFSIKGKDDKETAEQQRKIFENVYIAFLESIVSIAYNIYEEEKEETEPLLKSNSNTEKLPEGLTLILEENRILKQILDELKPLERSEYGNEIISLIGSDFYNNGKIKRTCLQKYFVKISSPSTSYMPSNEPAYLLEARKNIDEASEERVLDCYYASILLSGNVSFLREQIQNAIIKEEPESVKLLTKELLDLLEKYSPYLEDESVEKTKFFVRGTFDFINLHYLKMGNFDYYMDKDFKFLREKAFKLSGIFIKDEIFQKIKTLVNNINNNLANKDVFAYLNTKEFKDEVLAIFKKTNGFKEKNLETNKFEIIKEVIPAIIDGLLKNILLKDFSKLKEFVEFKRQLTIKLYNILGEFDGSIPNPYYVKPNPAYKEKKI